MITYYRALGENLEKKTVRVHSSAHGPEPSSSSSPSLARYRRFCPWRFDVRLDCHPCQVRCASFPSSPSLARYRRFCPWRFDVRLDCHPCQVRCASFPSSPSPLRYRRYCPWRFDVRLDCNPCQVRASFSSSPSPARHRRFCPWRFDVRLDCNPCQVRASFSSSPSPARYRRFCPWRFDVRLDCNRVRYPFPSFSSSPSLRTDCCTPGLKCLARLHGAKLQPWAETWGHAWQATTHPTCAQASAHRVNHGALLALAIHGRQPADPLAPGWAHQCRQEAEPGACANVR